LEGGLYNEIIKSDPRDSIGYRIIIFKEIANFVAHNSFTGSGFLGCWVMFDNLSCSTHNQYSDVLFREGLVSFFIYIYLLFRILKYLRTTNRDLFFGLVGILIYGVVHETFKLSHGGSF
jgi:O-antigen ligase